MVPCLIATPLSLILYGVGIHYRLHWICPTIGLGLCEYSRSGPHKSFPFLPSSLRVESNPEVVNFAIAQGTNVCLVYVIDGYRPVAGEITLAVMGFKCKTSRFLSPPLSPAYQQADIVPSIVRIPAVFLHQPVGGAVGLPKRLRLHGRDRHPGHSDVGAAVSIREADPAHHLALAHRVFHPLERRPRGWRVII